MARRGAGGDTSRSHHTRSMQSLPRDHISGRARYRPTSRAAHLHRVRQWRPVARRRACAGAGDPGMTLSLRPYQRAAIDALYDYFAGDIGNPLVVMPTGTGKSLCIAGFTREAISAWSDTRVLILTHVKELIQQNFMAMLRA